jgi:acetyl/propionyl-CoA carboxylase alpha subunit
MKVLVANRGEIAVRILRACRELGFPSVAVYSEADAQSLHTRYADECVFIGPTPAVESYLNIERILDAAKQSGAEAIHPGYGFLSENATFAQAVEDAGLIFIGPLPETISSTGDKLVARRVAREVNLPVLPGPDEPVADEIPESLIEQIKYPVLIKAVAGGGGRGTNDSSSPAGSPGSVRGRDCLFRTAGTASQAYRNPDHRGWVRADLVPGRT